MKLADYKLALERAQAELERLRARDSYAVQNPNVAFQTIRHLFDLERETFVVVLLNARQKVLSSSVIGLGSVAHVDVHPREVFRDAIRLSAYSIIVAHNHPSGDPQPSQADIVLTRRLVDVGRIMGIPVVDHLVVDSVRWTYVSMAERGMCG